MVLMPVILNTEQVILQHLSKLVNILSAKCVLIWLWFSYMIEIFFIKYEYDFFANMLVNYDFKYEYDFFKIRKSNMNMTFAKNPKIKYEYDFFCFFSYFFETQSWFFFYFLFIYIFLDFFTGKCDFLVILGLFQIWLFFAWLDKKNQISICYFPNMNMTF